MLCNNVFNERISRNKEMKKKDFFEVNLRVYFFYIIGICGFF